MTQCLYCKISVYTETVINTKLLIKNTGQTVAITQIFVIKIQEIQAPAVHSKPHTYSFAVISNKAATNSVLIATLQRKLPGTN